MPAPKGAKVRAIKMRGDRVVSVPKTVRNLKPGDIVQVGSRYIRVRRIARKGGGEWELIVSPATKVEAMKG